MPLKPDAVELMLSDSVKELLKLLQESCKRSRDGGEFEAGHKMGLVDALTVLQEEARSFGIEADRIALPSEDILTIALRASE